ncbi:MAG: copper resistance protein CopC [Halalkalicoccus sp.]
MSRGRSRLRGVLLVAAVACVLLAGAQVAGAHAYLAESDPSNGERVDEPPEAVVLSFSGDGVQIAEVSVTAPGGEDVSGAAEIDPDDSQRVLVPIEGGEDAVEGVYVVEWEVLADDGHTTSGTVLFTVGDEPLDREQVLELHEEDGEGVSPLEAGANALVLLSLIGLVGIPATLWVAVYPLVGRFGVPLAAAERRARWLLTVCAGLLFVGVVGLGLARSASVAPSLSLDSVGRFLGTSLGALWIGQLAVAAGVLGVFLLARRRKLARRYWLGGALAGGVAVQLSVSATSHSASLIDRLQGTAADFAHIGGAALWVGGLLVLGLVVPFALRDAPEERAALATAVRRFSIVALTGVTLAVATGLALAAWHAPDPATLRSTVYGTALSAKTTLVVLALGIGGVTRYVLLRRLERGEADAGTLVRAVRFEIGVLLAVVVVSGLITAAPTAAIAGDEGPSEGRLTGETSELAVTPAEEGTETALIDEGEPVVIDAIFRTDDEPVTVAEPTLLLRNDQFGVTYTVELDETDGGIYSTVQVLPEIGNWEVRASGQVDGSYESEWFDLYVIPDHPDHEGHAGEETAFAIWLRVGALAVGLAGTAAVLIEATRFDRTG